MLKKTLCLLVACLLACLTVYSALAVEEQPYVSALTDEEVPAPYDGQHHYLLLCTDVWHGNPDNLGNTDGIVIVTLDTRAHRIMLTSIIRDALVIRPDGIVGRINYIAKNYGPEALCQVISRHLGIKLEKYILFDFSQIQNIVDYLGGVELTISDAEASYLMRYAISKTSTTPAVTGAGTYLFGGHASVIYMRIRKAGGGGDFMRTQRVRTVLSGLADKCREISLEDAHNLVDNIMENTTMTNASLDELIEAADIAFSLKDCTVEELRIPQDGAYKASNYANMACQELDWESARATMDSYLQSSFLVMNDDEDDLFSLPEAE